MVLQAEAALDLAHGVATLDELRTALAANIDRYHDRPHSRLHYRTPKEVRQTWDNAQQSLHKSAA